MPELSGFEFLNNFEKISFKIIITTAYSEFALKAIKYAAFDFLLKPIDFAELREAIDKIKIANSIQKHTNFIQNKGVSTNLALPTSEGYSFIDIFEIIYCKSDNSYTDFILKESRKVMVSRGLKETSEMLEKHNFIRIHQSYLVNAKYIKKYNRRNNSIIVSNGDELPVSTRKKEEFLHFVGKY
jgi:two-component system LytT family response regulator